MRIKLAPSVLAAPFERLGEAVQAVERAGVDQIHIDVMDGHFVPNLSMGPVVVEALRRVTRLPLDVHLMITDPQRYLEAFVNAGADHISFHVEAVSDPRPLATWLQERDIGVGLALNPETPVERVLDFLPCFDLILVMTVRPGFGGQSFLPETLSKVRRVRQDALTGRSPDHPLDIQVDGGIDSQSARLARDAGANVFVAGSSVFTGGDFGEAVRALRKSLIIE